VFVLTKSYSYQVLLPRFFVWCVGRSVDRRRVGPSNNTLRSYSERNGERVSSDTLINATDKDREDSNIIAAVEQVSGKE